MAKVAASVPLDVSEKSYSRPRLPTPGSGCERRNILFVTSEFAGLIKVGGLGDVSAALPRALRARQDVRVLMPGYTQVMNSGYTIRVVGKVARRGALPGCRVGCIEMDDGIQVYVVICPELYERDGFPYGDRQGEDWEDNYLRFALLGYVACEVAAQRAGLGWRVDLVHINDWPAGLAPAYMRWRGVKVPTVFTIHNLQHQGNFHGVGARDLGAPASADVGAICVDDCISFLKAALVYADHLTTVSKAYAREITEPELGCGLQYILRQKEARNMLTGIVNGIGDDWQPYSDCHLLPFPAEWEGSGKHVHARYLEDKFFLNKNSGPVFAIVSRLVYQKGIDLSIALADSIVAAGGRLVVIGRGEPALENALLSLQARHPGHVGVMIGFNEQDGRRVFAGSDFLLMPSRFEPCGLSQLYAQRLGCLPIARRTGGLIDTIEDGATGFLFDHCTVADYATAVQRALAVYSRREVLRTMRYKAMSAPLYWHEAVQPYHDIYSRLIQGDTQPQVAAS